MSTRAEEGEIDQILADSFPASDAPPWTLGVTSPRSGVRTLKNAEADRSGGLDDNNQEGPVRDRSHEGKP
jgi:hypothetical protein